MTGRNTFEALNFYLQTIKGNQFPFVGVSILAIGDFSQLPPVAQPSIFCSAKLGIWKALFEGEKSNYLWGNFKLHELTEIFRQIGDPEFTKLLNKLRVARSADELEPSDIKQIRVLEESLSNWPNTYIKLYLTNYKANEENELLLNEVGNDTIEIKAKHSRRDAKTGTCMVSVNPNAPLSSTGKTLLQNYKPCVGARLMVTCNINVYDRLINESC